MHIAKKIMIKAITQYLFLLNDNCKIQIPKQTTKNEKKMMNKKKRNIENQEIGYI